MLNTLGGFGLTVAFPGLVVENCGRVVFDGLYGGLGLYVGLAGFFVVVGLAVEVDTDSVSEETALVVVILGASVEISSGSLLTGLSVIKLFDSPDTVWNVLNFMGISVLILEGNFDVAFPASSSGKSFTTAVVFISSLAILLSKVVSVSVFDSISTVVSVLNDAVSTFSVVVLTTSSTVVFLIGNTSGILLTLTLSSV